MIQDPNDAFDDVVDVGKVAAVFTVVEYGDLFACKDGFCELEKRHVWPSPGAIDSEEAQASGRQVVQMAVGVSHQLVAFLTSGVEAEGVVNVVMNRKGHRRICTVHAGTTSVHQVLHAVAAAAFQNVSEADDIAVDVSKWVLDGVAHTGLGSEVDNSLRFVGGKALFHGSTVPEVDTQVGVIGMACMPNQPRLLKIWIVIVVMIVDADDGVATP